MMVKLLEEKGRAHEGLEANKKCRADNVLPIPRHSGLIGFLCGGGGGQHIDILKNMLQVILVCIQYRDREAKKQVHDAQLFKI